MCTNCITVQCARGILSAFNIISMLSRYKLYRGDKIFGLDSLTKSILNIKYNSLYIWCYSEMCFDADDMKLCNVHVNTIHSIRMFVAINIIFFNDGFVRAFALYQQIFSLLPSCIVIPFRRNKNIWNKWYAYSVQAVRCESKTMMKRKKGNAHKYVLFNMTLNTTVNTIEFVR